MGKIPGRLQFESHYEKTNNVVSDQILHKPICTGTEDGWKLEILAVESRGNVLYNSKNKGADQLCSCCKAELCLCFCKFKWFLNFNYMKCT